MSRVAQAVEPIDGGFAVRDPWGAALAVVSPTEAERSAARRRPSSPRSAPRSRSTRTPGRPRAAAPQADGVTGLHHVALDCSSQAELTRVAKRLLDAGVQPCQALDHGTHVAVSVSDPDGNDVELPWDRVPHDWPPCDNAAFIDAPMNVDALIAHA